MGTGEVKTLREKAGQRTVTPIPTLDRKQGPDRPEPSPGWRSGMSESRVMG